MQQAIHTYRDGALKHAETCGVHLDDSPASMASVEEILAFMYNLTKQGVAKPSDAQITEFANGYGAYIGEVVRRLYGGEWQIFKEDPSSPFYDATALKTGGIFIFPPIRVYWRLTQGEETNIVKYYETIEAQLKGKRGS